MSHYFLVDCETTGLDPRKNALLTAAFFLVDGNLNVVDSAEYSVKHDEYLVVPRAMEVNKIDLVSHHRSAMSPTEIARKFLPTLETWKEINDDRSLIPLGHVVHFDIAFIGEQIKLIPWNQFLGHRFLDTASLAEGYKIEKRLPDDQSVSLESLASYFGIKYEAHTAKGDALATLEVLKHLTGHVRVEAL